VALVHTEVVPGFQGHGLASELVQGAMNDLRERGLKMIPVVLTFAPGFVAIPSKQTLRQSH
jgi:predicted GNAT family acetyltransferase